MRGATLSTTLDLHLPVGDGAQARSYEKREQKSSIEEEAAEEHEAPSRDPRIVPPSFQARQIHDRPASDDSRCSSIHS